MDLTEKLETILDRNFKVVKTGKSHPPFKIYSKSSNMFGSNSRMLNIGTVGMQRFLEDRFDKKKIDIPKLINNYIHKKINDTDIIKEQVSPKLKNKIYSLIDDNFEFRKTNGGGSYFDVYDKTGNKISFSTAIDFIADRVGTNYEASGIIDDYLVARFPDYYKTWRTKKSIVKENIIGNDKIEAKIKKLIDANFEFKRFFDINRPTLPGIKVYKKDNNQSTNPNEIETFIKDRVSSDEEKIKAFIQRYVGQKLARNEIEDLNESIGSEKLEYKIKKLLDKNFDFIFKHGLYIVNPKGSNNTDIENSLSDDDIEDFIVDRIGEIHRKEVMKFIYKYLLEKRSDSKNINEEISTKIYNGIMKRLHHMFKDIKKYKSGLAESSVYYIYDDRKISSINLKLKMMDLIRDLIYFPPEDKEERKLNMMDRVSIVNNFLEKIPIESKKINEEISDRTIDKILQKLTDKYYVKLINQIQFIFNRETNKPVLNGDVVLWNWIVDMIGETDEGMDLADKIYDEFIHVSLNENLIKEEIDNMKMLDKVLKKLSNRFIINDDKLGTYFKDRNTNNFVTAKIIHDYMYDLLGDMTSDARNYIFNKFIDYNRKIN